MPLPNKIFDSLVPHALVLFLILILWLVFGKKILNRICNIHNYSENNTKLTNAVGNLAKKLEELGVEVDNNDRNPLTG